MFVNKYRLNNNLSGDTSWNINIPIGDNIGMLGQWETINKDFIDIEVDKAVNIIYDYEKVKLLPKVNNDLVELITYKINLLTSSGTYNTSVNWSDIGFIDDDLRFKKNSFTKSFLRLDFYDSDIATDQNLISFITLYPKFSYGDVYLSPTKGKIPSASNYSLSFVLGNPLINSNLNGEGFSLYHFKDEIIPDILLSPQVLPKYLYMRATFNNAKTGKSIGLMASSNPNLSIDELIETTKDKFISTPSKKNNLYTRYILKREASGYYYEIDTDYSDGNVVYVPSTKRYVVNLNEINTI